MDTSQKIKHYLEIQEQLEDIATEYLDEFASLSNPSLESVTIEGDQIYIEYEDSWNYGGWERDSTTIPLSYLTDPDWKIAEREKQREEEMKKLRETFAKKEKEKKEAEEKEYKQFLELKEKYDEN